MATQQIITMFAIGRRYENREDAIKTWLITYTHIVYNWATTWKEGRHIYNMANTTDTNIVYN